LKKYNFIFFTTCDANGERIQDMLRLLDSVDHAINEHKVTVKHYILLQRADKLPDELSNKTSPDREFMIFDTRLSLSRARNIMINKAMQENMFDHADICAFPDDDAWYPNGFLHTAHQFLMGKVDASIFICDYGSSPVPEINSISDLQVRDRQPSVRSYITTVSSNTMFIKSKIALENSFFDERLGVGAEINGGEDLDYALRAYMKANGKALMSRLKLVGHRDRVIWVRSAYYSGSLFAIARSARNNKQVLVQMIRKIAVGGYFVLKGELKLSKYLRFLTIGIKGFSTQTLQVDDFN